jgi:DMSO/TMAO reductase YedYZ molybdopterin-dependent catalytic subunit
MTTRRKLLQVAGGLALGGRGLLELAGAALPSGAQESQLLDRLAGKQPLLKRSFRPPNYESPLSYLDGPITPNDKFFVRWHLANIPTVDARTWRLRVTGDAAGQHLELGIEQLKSEFEPIELVAVCQCAGNQRGLAEPHAPGVQWGSGAVGNARWKGARLKDILARAQLRADALEVAFDGADGPVLPQTPDFAKSIPLWKALDEHTLLAYEMNGAPLPHWNGFPVRAVVPGWAGTYWVKQLTTVSVLDKPLASFWMSTAYRLPRGKYAATDRFASQESDTTEPIVEVDLNSIVTNLTDGQQFRAGRPVGVRGVAWDSGAGIKQVEVSVDQGTSWQSAKLGRDLGRYSFRTWQFSFIPREPGAMTVMTRASNARGAVQPPGWVANGAGYRNNAIQAVGIRIV